MHLTLREAAAFKPYVTHAGEACLEGVLDARSLSISFGMTGP